MTYSVTIHYSPSIYPQIESWLIASNITNYGENVIMDYESGRSQLRIDFVHQADAVQFKLAWADILV